MAGESQCLMSKKPFVYPARWWPLERLIFRTGG
jgi:hypothetical protein